MDKPTPRVDQSLSHQFNGQTVRVVGRVDGINQSENRIKFYSPSPNNENVMDLSYSQDLDFKQGHWYECVARVMGTSEVRAIDNTDIGENINEKALAGLIKHIHKSAPALFFDQSDY